ncbi:MAG: hypothetical protein SGBAC_001716 [Bacillariaceae sp.]
MNEALSRQVSTVRLSFEGGESHSVQVVDEYSAELLKQAIDSNSTAADALLSEISMMRENAVSQEAVESYLNNLLSAGPDNRLPFWARSKRLSRFSRRARMASLRRTLDLTTPVPEAEEETVERKLGRRRRALVALLRSISAEKSLDSKEPAIVTLEKRARLANKESDADMKSRMPDGLETPDYDIVATFKHNGQTVEIRRYKPFSVCAVNMNKPRPEAAKESDNKVRVPEISGASSFGALAGYLFGKNDQSTAMKMTTPVFTSTLEAGDKQMEFVLPSNYWDDDSLGAAPKPLSGSGVSLQRRDSQDRAVLMFGGYASKKEVAKRKKELMAALKRGKQWNADEEEATTAQYNDPFTVPWRRLNEVSIKVVPK